MNVKELKQFIKKFRIDNDTVILVKQGSALADKMTLESFEQVVKQMGLKNVLVIVVDDLDDAQVFNKLDMNRLGWYRLHDVRRLVSPKREEKEVESN
jgi:hypothetical protein